MLFADLRSAVRQAAAPGSVNQFPGLAITGRILEGGTARARAHRLRGFTRSADFSKPRCDGGFITGNGAKPCPHHNTACRQLRMAIGEMQRFSIQTQQTFRRGDFCPIQNILDLNAISAGIHRNRAADAAWNTDQKFKPREPSSGSGFRHRHIQSGGAGDDAVGFHHHITKPAREAQHHTRNAAITNDQV